MKSILTQLLVGFLWCLHWLPLPLLRLLGRTLGALLWLTARSRRRIALINLERCFPERTTAAREAIAREHFRIVAQALLDRTVLWWGSPARLKRMIEVQGEEHLLTHRGRPVILLAPHFSGLDAGGVGLSMSHHVVSMYAAQSNKVIDRLLHMGRTRFNSPALYSRQDGIRPVIRHVREGIPFYCLPDMDFGARDALFVPFFHPLAATVTVVSRLARMTNAVVVPTLSVLTPTGYRFQYLPAWQNYPGASVEEDTARMNREIEALARAHPAHYYWVHKRFKTRPPGEASFY